MTLTLVWISNSPSYCYTNGACNSRRRNMLPANLEKEAIKVKHADLQRLKDCESRFRRQCPVCKEGILFVTRSSHTFLIAEDDTCVLCGQRYVYEDVEDLRKGDWGGVA